MTRFIASICCFAFAALVAEGAAAASLQFHIIDQDGNPVEDAVGYVRSVDGETPAPAPMTAAVDQVDETFVPHVRAVTVGSQVSFPNSDHIHHHVYSFSDARTFEVPLYIGENADPVQFDRAGIVTLSCNIHDHMLGYVLVLPSPWFVEIRGGEGLIADLPGGDWAVEVWHPRLLDAEVITRSMRAGPEEAAVLELQVSLRPERRVLRAPRRGGSRY